MHTTIKIVLVVAIIAPVLLLPVFGYGIIAGTMVYDEMMGSGITGVIGWMLLPTLLCLVLDVVLFTHLFGNKHV